MKAMRQFRIKRFPDNCYAVVSGARRGPVGPDRRRAKQRYVRAGFISFAGTDKPFYRVNH